MHYNIFFDFLSLADPNVKFVLLGTILLTISSAMIGSFTLLQQKTLVSDAIAHAVLPGICLAFMITGTKHLTFLTIGAFITGWMASLCIDGITYHSKIKKDTAIALVLSVYFGVGSLLLTIIQSAGNAVQGGLKYFLLGSAATLVPEDIIVLALLSIVVIITIIVFFKEFKLISFDKTFALSIGLPVKRLEFLLTSLTVLAIIVGIRTVGIVLMSAMLITPPAAAHFWTHHLNKMIWLAAILAAISGVVGTFISYMAPAMPTGPWIVIIISFIAYLSFIFFPYKREFFPNIGKTNELFYSYWVYVRI